MNSIPIDSLGLSVRSTNVLLRKGIDTAGKLLAVDEDTLRSFRNLGEKSVTEILRLQQRLSAGEDPTKDIVPDPGADGSGAELPLEQTAEYRECLLRYVKAKDVPLSSLPLTTRAHNRLDMLGYTMLSEIILFDSAWFRQIRSLGESSVQSILAAISDYMDRHGSKILAMYRGEDVLRLSEDDIRDAVLELYRAMGFAGLSLGELMERLSLDESYLQPVKTVLGRLIAEGQLEYVDYRCHRVYPKLRDYLPRCESIDERNREIVAKRLGGMTLQATADEYGLTRERVRQIVDSCVRKVRRQYSIDTGLENFDEDYYRYLFENYSFDARDAAPWLGIPEYVFNYFDTLNIKQGQKSLEEALSDSTGLDAGMRLKIRSYLNRGRLMIDGRWVKKSRLALEEALVRKFCRDDVSFEDFMGLYNGFLEAEEVPYDEKLYYTDAVIRTRENRLSEARFLLWKQNKRLRYYDIDGTDFTELLDTLDLDGYENIELSTLKFMSMYPELMEKYDIRDHYELHNLLKKLVPEGGRNDLRFGRMPMIKFGDFDRDSAIFNIIIDNSPIGIYELADLVQEEYGYDRDTLIWNYLPPFRAYCHSGVYSVDHKEMPSENMERLSAALCEDFYYLDEIRQLYTRLIPGADVEEINPFNLKSMGFTVLSRYALRNHDSLEAYFRKLLTAGDIIDISAMRKRYANVQMFYQVFLALRRSLVVIEFEPDRIISMKRLEHSGVTRSDIEVYCEAVYDFAEEERYFTLQSLRQDGFDSGLFELGFSDFFYANLLLSDERYTVDRFFGNTVFYKGKKSMNAKTFLADYIREQGSIDMYDLMNELSDRYGFVFEDRYDISQKLVNSEVYYDKYLDRYYASESLYFRELDEL